MQMVDTIRDAMIMTRIIRLRVSGIRDSGFGICGITVSRCTSDMTSREHRIPRLNESQIPNPESRYPVRVLYDAIVVGVGGMGSAAVHHLAARGAKVLGLEQYAIPHDRGSSHGLSRIIRLAYWEHPAYVPLVRRAYALWRELEAASGEPLLVVTGSIDAGERGSANVLGARTACVDFDLPFEELDAAALHARFPGYRLPAGVTSIHQPDGGFLLPEACIVQHVALARGRGADIRADQRVLGWDAGDGGVSVRTAAGEHRASHLVFTAGAWTGSLMPRAAPALTPERQVMLWTRPLRPERFQVGVFPVFYISIAGVPFYGFPSHDDAGFKIGRYHHRGERVDPDAMDRTCHAEDERVLRDGIRRFFPDADGPTLAMKTCLFTNTPDEHFVIDRLPGTPRVAIAAGFSGHGFKFCSVVGEILADLALEGGTRHDISLFPLARLPIAFQ
jgi:sarcosine oxidase